MDDVFNPGAVNAEVLVDDDIAQTPSCSSPKCVAYSRQLVDARRNVAEPLLVRPTHNGTASASAVSAIP